MEVTITIPKDARLERLLTTNPDMEKKVRRIVRQVIIGAQSRVQDAAKPMSTKEAYKAVYSVVYKKVLGGNINLAPSSRRSGQRAPLPPVRHALVEGVNRKGNHRGGNRMPRSSRTEDLLTYTGADRGFILRFLNNGTEDRHNGTRRTGAIAPRNWFSGVSVQAFNHAAEQFDLLLDQLIAKEFGSK